MRQLENHAKWRQYAACTGLPMAIFYPDTDEEAGTAKLICAGCIVRTRCLEEALANRESDGVWGGLTAHERKQLRRRQRTAATAVPA